MASKKLVARSLVFAMFGTVALLPQSRRDQARGNPGEFDFYLMSLSWSPQHCATNGANDRTQCGDGKHFGFVLHGLWPQWERGFPQSCAGAPALSRSLVDRMLPIMPSPQLIRHEWEKHGTCSGLDAPQYFGKAEQAFRSVKIPEKYVNPSDALRLSPAALKKDLLAANPKIPDAGMVVLCSGRFLQEVRVCFTKDLQTRACSREVQRGCQLDEIIVQPIR